jgi:hypothetical protein
VRTTPVVQVLIDGETITIDGVVLPDCVEPMAPFDRALAALAMRATKRRPVRAEITEASGISRCKVTAAGTAEELRFTLTSPGGGLPAQPPVVATRRIVQPRQRPPVPVPWRPLAGVAVAVVVLAGIGLSLGHLPARTSPAMAEVVAVTASPMPMAQRVRPGADFRQLPALAISAVGQVGAIEFVGDHLRVEVVVDGVTHGLRLGPDGALVDGLAPGTHTWTARASGHLDASGSVVVPAPAPTPSMPEPTIQPSIRPSQPTTQLTFDPPIDPDRTD